MTFATGVAKQVVIVKEVTEGVNPVTGGKTLRRVSSDLALNKDSYESQEILVSQQLRDARHGVHRPQGTFSGQLSPGSYDDFFEGILRNTWATTSPLASITLTLAHVAGTLTGTGFSAAGLKKGDVFAITGAGSPNTAINGVRMRISALSDTVITTTDLPTGLTDGSLATVTLTVIGKKLWMPPTGAVLNSYTIEHWFGDVSQSEAFLGCKFGQTSIQLPATGLVTFSTQIIGIDMVQNTSRQLTSPGAQTSSSALAAVNGKLTFAGTDIAIVTGMTIQLAGRLGADPVVGSNIVPHIFNGRFGVTGSMTVLFQDQVVANNFVNEVEVGVSLMLYSGSAATSDFMRITMPRVKLMSNAKSDGDMSLVQSFNYTALENVADTFSDPSTIVLQDSLA